MKISREKACQAQTIIWAQRDMYSGFINISSMDIFASLWTPISLEERYASFKRRLAKRLSR